MIYAIIVGHLGTDAKKIEKEGKTEIHFNVASYMHVAGIEKTTWISCHSDKELDGFEYLRKGAIVYVSGDLNIDVFQKDDTETILSVVLTVAKLELLKKTEEIW